MYYIYEIYNKVTGRKYIGMTQNYKQRFKQHLSQLKCGIHTEKLLQKDYVLYGEDSFDYRLLEVVDDKKTAMSREHHYMVFYKTYFEDYGYNSQDTLFNKYQNNNESVNSQNFFYRKIKETGLPLCKVANAIGISRKSLIHGITHPQSMSARAFLNLVNFIPLDKNEAAMFMGWLTEENKPKHIKDFAQLSENDQDLVIQIMQSLLANKNRKEKAYGEEDITEA